MVREMTFQSSFSDIGITGCTFIVKRSPSLVGPMSPSQFIWNGTLISAAIGLASCFARSSADWQ
jgi:hypothetical protein